MDREVKVAIYSQACDEFSEWWDREGRAAMERVCGGECCEEAGRDVVRIAWANGAYKALYPGVM